MFLSTVEAQQIYHYCGRLPGDHPDNEYTSAVYYALAPIIDRLVEYDG